MIKKSLFNSIDNTARQILYFYVISINKRFIYNQAFEETIEYGEKTDDVIEVNNLANGEKILELENWNKIINKL